MNWPLRNPKSKIQNPKSERGSALVEMALLSPLFMLMLIGTIDFGRVMYDGIAVTNAARAGVQYGAQNAATSEDMAGIQQAALNDAGNIQGLSITAQRYCQCDDGTVINCSDTCGISGAPRVYVRVIGQKTFQTIFPYPGIPHTVNLSQTTVMRAQ